MIESLFIPFIALAIGLMIFGVATYVAKHGG
jgi:hypothetical protein